MHAWVTSVVQEEQVDQALVLAGSLRRWRTAMKLVVIAASNISKSSRQRLSTVFDLAVRVPHDEEVLGEPASAIMAALSLVLFKKCVYLSPSMLVLNNCDHLFEEYHHVSRSSHIQQNMNCIIFKPSTKLDQSVRNKLMELQAASPELSAVQILETAVVTLSGVENIERLDDQYNVDIILGKAGTPTFFLGSKAASIANFKGVHPTQLWRSGAQPPNTHDAEWSTLIENVALAKAWKILLEDIAGEQIAPAPENSCGGNEPVAIVGMSFRLPGGNTPDQFWTTLVEGKDVVRDVPPGRWAQNQVREYWKDQHVQGGFLNVPLDEFDAKFFEISRKEATVMDPQQRLLLEVSWEALEDAGIEPASLHGSQTGVFSGSWTNSYRELTLLTPDFDFFRSYMGNSIATGAARLSHFLGCTGPSIATESGCSSAIVAVDLAVKSLRARECPLALACGVNLLIKPFNYQMMEGVLAPDYRCKTFDASANGFVRAEGVATLVMKRLSDALREGDNIWGIVRGTGIAQEGVSKSLGTPTVQVESLAMKLALRAAGVEPADVSYIEMHGTGTPVGDPMEVSAVAEAYRSKDRKNPLIIGSVKTNIGHTESASGITGIIKVLLSMKHEKLPPHLHLEKLNPGIQLEQIPGIIPTQVMEWRRESGGRSRIAGVSSFGISGTDGHAIIEEPPAQTRLHAAGTSSSNPERPLQLLKLSAKCPESLGGLVERYTELLEGADSRDLDFRDICYSANTSRSTFSHRAVVVASGSSKAAQILREGSFKKMELQVTTKSLCLLFTGQGSQYHGMASTLYATSPTFRLHFDKAESMLQSLYSISIKDIMWGESSSEAQLSRTLYSQTSIFVVEYCLLRLWESWGVKPDYVLGHSLGEFTAAVAAGVLDFQEALLLVSERSRLIDNLTPGKMLVIKANSAEVERTIMKYKSQNGDGFWVDIAALNSNEQTVLAGDSDLIQGFAKFCTQSGLKNIMLASTHAFHSRHMDPMLEAYGRVANTIQYGNDRRRSRDDWPRYISGMEGRLIPTEQINADYWIRHTREKVSFMAATREAAVEGVSVFLEVGPHPILSALTAMNLEDSSAAAVTCLPSLRRSTDDWSVLLESLAQLYLSGWAGSIDWKGFDRDYHWRRRVPLPFYPFNRKSVWLDLRPEPGLLHPLVGRLIPSSTNHFLYDNELLLKQLPYLGDHVIGNTIVFPGAGFLEMCLAAGYASVQRLKNELTMPRRSIRLSGLTIATPLAVHESRATLLQTAVLLDEEQQQEEGGGYTVKVSRLHSEQSGEAEWVTHARAKFHPTISSSLLLPVVSSNHNNKIDIESKSSCWAPFSLADFYSSLPQVGLRFGPSFQSLDSGWKSEGEGVLLKLKKIPADHHEPYHYLIHPILADAMLQAVMLWTSGSEESESRKKLQVPVSIGEFIWVQSSRAEQEATSSRYILCRTEPDGTVACTLVDGEGSLLATMSSVEFLETNVKLVEGMITQQSVAMPKIWEEIFKSGGPGPLAGRLPMEDTRWEPSDTFLNLKKNCPVVSEEERVFYGRLCNMTRSLVLEALYSCGWTPLQHQPFSVEQLLESLKISICHRGYVHFFLRSMAGVGLLGWEESTNTFRFLAKPPTSHEIRAELVDLLTRPEELSRTEYKLTVDVGQNLKGILLGDVSPLQILFPGDPSKPSAAQLYDQLIVMFGGAIHVANEQVLRPILHQAAANHQPQQSGGGGGVIVEVAKGVVRILEVGAGTGAYSRQMLAFLATLPHPIEYYYTDVSPSFFGAAKEEFEGKYYGTLGLVFKTLDMEEDPLEQGFSPGYFDLLLACEALHVTSNIKATLCRLRPLLKPGGVIQIVETIVQDPRITFSFGLLEGYWKFQDLDFRRDHITLSPAMWEEALLSASFEKVELIPGYQGVHGVIVAFASKEERRSMLSELGPPRNAWLLFDDGSPLSQRLAEKLASLNRQVVLLPRSPKGCKETTMEAEFKELLQSLLLPLATGSNKAVKLEGVLYLWGMCGAGGEQDQSQISLPLVTLSQVLSGAEIRTRVVVVTKGIRDVDGSPLELPFPGTLIGLSRAISTEHRTLHIKRLDASPVDNSLTCQVEEILGNLWKEDRSHPEIAFREGLQFLPKFVPCNLNSKDYCPLPHGTNRFQLVLPASKQLSDLEFAFLEHTQLEEDELEIEVKATALNFRDVFAVLKPTPEFERINAVGLDVAGMVSKVGARVTNYKVGDRVIGMQNELNLALPSHVKLRETLAIPLPHQLTFVEGATIPAVFATAHYCLLTVAKMKGGERLLVHTASGGVGLAAIQLARRVGAEVIATAGSPRKRRFLRELGIMHIFNSRSTEFGAKVREAVGGGGVDIVLNSLTGPGFKEESLRVLKHGGRFVEMSKLNVWSVEEVAVLRPDVSYSIADVSSLDDETLTELSSTVKGSLQQGLVHPISYERFDALNIRGALTHMQKAKHIGKIVTVMPELGPEGKNYQARTPLFHENTTYLVTGGLGGIGLEVVKWILRSGGKHVVIASRNSPSPAIAAQIQLWNNKEGKHVVAVAVDVGNWEGCQQLLTDIKEDPTFPPLRGVMHAAGVLADASLHNLSWEKFRTTFNPKVDGSWNLHQMTKGMLLEHFVLFSSITATFGAPGQANHSASNSFQDTLARYRHSIGLPATSVNWGNWGEVGVATDIDFPGVTPISTAQGILALETLLRSPAKVNVGVANIDSFALLSKLFTNIKDFVDDRSLLGDSAATTTTIIVNGSEFWARMDATTEAEAKLALFLDLVKTTLRIVLRAEPEELIDDDADFGSLGVDSLMMLEVKNGIQNILEGRVTLTMGHVQGCNTSALLAKRLLSLFQNVQENLECLPTLEELKVLVREDSQLPAHIRGDLHPAAAVSVPWQSSRVQSVLLTGVTGTLGPFLLYELARRPGLQTVHCLIRGAAAGKLSPTERLVAALEKSGLTGLIDLSKVNCIQGDISEPNFGLTQTNYDALATAVDTVIHSGVKVDYNATYWRSPPSDKSAVRTINVGGTLRVLEFCTSQRLKQLCFISTMLVYGKLGEDGCLSEGWQELDAFDATTINTGYPISKHVCEQLVRQAVEERGLPVKTVRLPLVGGHSLTGRVEPNHFLLRFLAEMKLGCMPDLSFPLPYIPVDRCADLLLQIFFHDKSSCDVYNLIPKVPVWEQEFVSVAKLEFGIDIALVGYQEFIDKVLAEDESSPLAPFKSVYAQDFATNPDSPFVKIMRGFAVHSDHFYANGKTVEILPDLEAQLEPSPVCWGRDLRYLRDSGLFEKFGILYK